jgi:fructose-specific phosphotransferase system IIC component
MRKLPAILTAVYLILVVVSIIPIFTGDDPLSGIFAVVLTVPWSPLLSRPLPGNLFVGLLAVAVGAAINAAILYFVSRWLVRVLAR